MDSNSFEYFYIIIVLPSQNQVGNLAASFERFGTNNTSMAFTPIVLQVMLMPSEAGAFA